MTDLFDTAPARAGNATAAARHVAASIASGVKITRAKLNDAMANAFGGSDADGHWTQRESFEILEHATVLAVNGGAKPPSIAEAIALVGRLPTQTVRSEEQIDWQQFSTPLDLAAVACLLAAPQDDDIVLEPSAGNGLLIACLPPVAALHLNEIDPARRARLAAAYPLASVTGHDGAQIASVMTAAPRPGLILMNPPFWADYTKVRFTYARGEPLANAGEWHHAARSEEGVRNGRSWPGSGRLSTFQR